MAHLAQEIDIPSHLMKSKLCDHPTLIAQPRNFIFVVCDIKRGGGAFLR